MLELVPFTEPPLDEFGLILGGGGGGGRGEPAEFPIFKLIDQFVCFWNFRF